MSDYHSNLLQQLRCLIVKYIVSGFCYNELKVNDFEEYN